MEDWDFLQIAQKTQGKREKKTLRRILSFLLVIVLAVSLIPLSSVVRAETNVITQNGGQVTYEEDVTLSVSEADDWYIYIPSADVWALFDEDTDETTLTAAMVYPLGDTVQVKTSTAEEVSVAVDLETVEAEEAELYSNSMTLFGSGFANSAADTYNVVVNYIFSDNTVAAEPSVYTVEAGEALEEHISLPQITGYDPYVEDGEESQTTLDLVYDEINENIIINVVYKPAQVTYTVRHYLQNAENDEYTLDLVETKTGFTEDVPTDLALSYDGFYALPVEEAALAADGSTILEVYYDRNYYLMNFKLGGGSGQDPIYGKYGKAVTVKEPTRSGYSFAGWDVTPPSTIPLGNSTYTAQWTAESTQYKVVYWLKDPGTDHYSYLGSDIQYADTGMLVSASDNIPDSIAGENAGVIIYNAERSDADVEVNGDGDTIVNVYYDRETYDIKFYEYDSSASGYTYVYTSSGTNGTSMYGLVNGEYVALTRVRSGRNYYYYYTNSAGTQTRYTGTRYTRSSVAGQWVENRDLRITAEYGQDVSSLWPSEVDSSYNTMWGTTYNGRTAGSPYVSGVSAMPIGGATYYSTGTPTGTYTMNVIYMIESVDEPGTYIEHHTDTFKSNSTKWYTTEEDHYGIDGFTYTNNLPDGSGFTYVGNYTYQAVFYYDRNEYSITYISVDETLTSDADGNDLTAAAYTNIPYETELSGYDIEPPYPSVYPIGAYEFAGWYDNADLVGDPFDFDSEMGIGNITLFAKWTPVTHTVTVYQDLTAMENGDEPLAAETAAHGDIAATPDTPESENYSFVGWFYTNEYGEEVPFLFSDTPITRDISVYAKWTSDVLVPYTVHFVDEETGEEVAPSLTGYGLAGSTKTFSAASDTLYDDYASGYFPYTPSHSILLDIKAQSDPALNEYTFYYVHKDSVPYTVRYVDARTGEELYPEKYVSENKNAKVTEKFIPIDGYVPDRYQKSLIVSAADEEANVITFYYTADDLHAYYLTNYYIEDDNGGYRLYNALETFGTIGETAEAAEIDIPGYTLNPDAEGTVRSAVITAEGTELNLYYDRNTYPYKIRYLETKTNAVLAEEVTGTAKFDSTITADPIEIEGYTYLESSKNSIQIVRDTDDIEYNVITLYYEIEQAHIDYVAVGEGTVSRGNESVAKKSGIAQGSTAQADENAVFLGWYADEACTELLSKDLSYAPEKGEDGYEDATYYAKFAHIIQLPWTGGNSILFFSILGAALAAVGPIWMKVRKKL